MEGPDVTALTDWRSTLRAEFGADDGSFLLRLWMTRRWDKAAFIRLTNAMMACCEQYEGSETMESWLAQGFYLVPTFTRHWVSSPDSPREHPQAYYQVALQRLDDLARWFFFGESPYLSGHEWHPL